MTIGYGKVERSTWEDDKFLRLSPIAPSAQGLWVFLLSCPLALPPVPGLIRGGRAALAEIIRWSPEDFARCWNEIEAAGMAVADWDGRIVWLPNAVRFDPPDNANMVVGWSRALVSLPNTPIRNRIVEDLVSALIDLDDERDSESRAGDRLPSFREAFEASWSKLDGSQFKRGSAALRRRVPETVPGTVPPTVPPTHPKPARTQGAFSLEQGTENQEQGAGKAQALRAPAHEPVSSGAPVADLPAYLELLRRHHPRFCDEFAITNALQEQCRSLPDLATFESNLIAWSASEQWTEEGGRYVPKPARWIREGGFRTPPPAPRAGGRRRGAGAAIVAPVSSEVEAAVAELGAARSPA